jgi:hypothetical protein
LSRPRVSRALARPRLFAALDRALAARGVWIAGPPGGGKTTLVSTYLDARKHSVQWYQLDAQDAQRTWTQPAFGVKIAHVSCRIFGGGGWDRSAQSTSLNTMK